MEQALSIKFDRSAPPALAQFDPALGDVRPYPHPLFSWVFDLSVVCAAVVMKANWELGLIGERERLSAIYYLEYMMDMRLQNRRMAFRPPPASAKDRKKKKMAALRDKAPNVHVPQVCSIFPVCLSLCSIFVPHVVWHVMRSCC